MRLPYGHLPPIPNHTHFNTSNNTTIPQTNKLDLLFIIVPTKVTKTKPMSYTHIEVFVICNFVWGRKGRWHTPFRSIPTEIQRTYFPVGKSTGDDEKRDSSSLPRMQQQSGWHSPFRLSILPDSLQPSLYSPTHTPMVVDRDTQLRTRASLVAGAGEVFTL